MLLFMSVNAPTGDASVQGLPEEVPPLRSREYVSYRANQLLQENARLNLPTLGSFVLSFVELEAEADRQAQQWGRRAGRYNGLYVLLGLPATVLAAVAGVTALASTAGRLVAGVVALMSAALSASATFLDSAQKRDQAARLHAEWENLYNEMRLSRWTELASFTTDSGYSRLTAFAARAAAIRAGRDQTATKTSGSPEGLAIKPLFQRVPDMWGLSESAARLEMGAMSLVLTVENNTDSRRGRRYPGSKPLDEPEIVGQSIPNGTPVPEGTPVCVWVIPAGYQELSGS